MANLISNWLDSRGHTHNTFLKEVVLARCYHLLMLILVFVPEILAISHFRKILFPILPPGTIGLPVVLRLMSTEAKVIWGLLLLHFSGAVTIVPLVSRWRKFAHRFPAPPRFREGQWFKKEHDLSVGIWQYGHTVKLGVSPQGLYLSCVFPLLLTHPPMLIPWQQVKAIRQRRFFGRTTTYLVIGSLRLGIIALKNATVLDAIQPWLPREAINAPLVSAPSTL